MAWTWHEFPHTRNYDSDLREVIAELYNIEDAIDHYADVISTLEEAIKDIGQMQSDILALKVATIDLPQIRSSISALNTELRTVEAKVENLEIDMNSVYDYVNTRIAVVEALAKAYHDELLNKIQMLEYTLGVEFNVLKKQLEAKYAELEEKIEQLVPTDVYNRVAGKRLSLDDNNFNVYEDLRCGGLTNAELAEFGRSNNYIASIVLNNRDFAINLRKRLKLHYLFSPVSGKKVSHANAISQAIAVFTNNGRTGASNNELYSIMEADSATNEDYASYFDTNFGRYFFMAG